MQRSMMGDDALAPMIPVEARMMPFCKSPILIPFEDEVSASCGVSECHISNSS
jgi:hypothetical protein